MNQTGTRERLLVCAEKLMARQGIAGTSVRAITEEANANIAAVNYHFGGKEELVREVLYARFTRLDALLLEGLDSMTSRCSANGTNVQLKDVVAVYFDTLILIGIDRKNHTMDPFILLVQQASTYNQKTLRSAQNLQAPGITRLVEMISQSSGKKVAMGVDIETLITLMYIGAVEAMEMIVSHPRDDTNTQRHVDAVRNYVIAGAHGYLDTLFDQDNAQLPGEQGLPRGQ